MASPKVFLLGLDGGTWRVLDKLMAKGIMPNLKRLADEGAKGTLRSTIPYSRGVVERAHGGKPGQARHIRLSCHGEQRWGHSHPPG